jgi:hypothetical protein
MQRVWQDPIDSYGVTVKKELQEVSKKYDPTGMFQKQVPGGVKLFASTSRTGLGHREPGQSLCWFGKREKGEDHRADGVETRDVNIGGMDARSTPVYRTSFLTLRVDIHDEAFVSNVQMDQPYVATYA